MRTSLIATVLVTAALLFQTASTCEAVEEKVTAKSIGTDTAVMRPRTPVFPRPKDAAAKPEAKEELTAHQGQPRPLPLLKQVGDQVTRRLQKKVNEEADRIVRQLSGRIPSP